MALDDDSPQPTSPRSQPSKPTSLPSPLAPGVKFNPQFIHRPDPVTLYFAFFGPRSWERKVHTAVTRIAEASSVDINRPLTQSELDFHTENASLTFYHGRLGLVLGSLAGTTHAAAWETKHNIISRYAPPATDNISPAKRMYQGLKNLIQMDPVLANAAGRAALVRIVMWAGCGWIASSTYSMVTAVQRVGTDPRIKPFFEERMNQNQDERKKRQRQAMIARARQPVEQATTSEQEGSFEQSWEESSATNSFESVDAAASAPSAASRTYGYDDRQDQNKGGGFFDDDASPIAPDHRDTAPQGSAWERIRQQNQQRPSRPPSVPRWDPQTRSDTQPRNDSQNERERAQAEFDRMLDAERIRGSDSDPGDRRAGESRW